MGEVKTKLTSYYLIVDEHQMGFAEQVRVRMKELFRLIGAELRVSGGGDGDLHEERAEWNAFCTGRDEYFELYTVTDSNANGYAECISIICRLPKDEDYTQITSVFLAFIHQNDFVASHRSFIKRPQGYKSFFGYLDNLYQRVHSVCPFVTQDGQGD